VNSIALRTPHLLSVTATPAYHLAFDKNPQSSELTTCRCSLRRWKRGWVYL
jgi:hypothetical protein